MSLRVLTEWETNHGDKSYQIMFLVKGESWNTHS